MVLLQAFESFVCRCPKEVTQYIPKVTWRSLAVLYLYHYCKTLQMYTHIHVSVVQALRIFSKTTCKPKAFVPISCYKLHIQFVLCLYIVSPSFDWGKRKTCTLKQFDVHLLCVQHEVVHCFYYLQTRAAVDSERWLTSFQFCS